MPSQLTSYSAINIYRNVNGLWISHRSRLLEEWRRHQLHIRSRSFSSRSGGWWHIYCSRLRLVSIEIAWGNIPIVH
ncbi:hypothetical protein HBI56_099770 [Parastagonospora nodorum]|nr:hypothetical protein HBH73_181960 [Parastagonospora nodorum]KAH4953362.1 hypothetical protein HBH74_005120 [Parastagonospora nodorum]KAH5334210.1 hypothetical protein HBI50_039090 [Parastagonospora nodorum]KAH6001355.1 hypothetical protein HBI84_093310 [Parastagonospora nodorum]KAH6162750.1 hypothetical protein HBI63_034950 [Parastagonospora nodorum]